MPDGQRDKSSRWTLVHAIRRACWLGVLLVVAGGETARAAVLPAGSFVFDGEVSSIVRSGSDVFVGGAFSQQQTATGGGLVLSQDGTGEPDPSKFPQVDGSVDAVASDGSGGWFIGGGFTHVGGQPRHGLAHILPDGTLDASWDPSPDGHADAFAVSGSTLYVGGSFSSIGGQARKGVAALDLTTGAVSAWDPDCNGSVRDIVVVGSTVYLTGAFSSMGGQLRQGLAAVDAATGDTTAWDPDSNGVVSMLAVSGSTLYAGGEFSSIGGQSRSNLAALDATTGDATAWNPSPSGGGSDPSVITLAVSGSTIYAGGRFASIGGQARNGLAALDITTGDARAWNPDPSGAFQGIKALAVSGSTVYVAGDFTSIGGQPRSNVAALDGTTGNATAWNPNPNRLVEALATSGSTIYVGGDFSGAGAPLATVAHVAKLSAAGDLDGSWNGTPTTSQLPLLERVRALAVSGSTVYAGGDFSSLGGQPRTNLAALDAVTGDATAWNPSPDDDVQALATSGSTVYAGGSFASIGGQQRAGLAALSSATGNATAWNPNPDVSVTTLAVAASTVYVGGAFESIGGQSRRTLAAVDALTGTATAWNPSPAGLFGLLVEHLAISGSSVYIAGEFSSIGGQPRRNLAAVDAVTGEATAWNPSPNSFVTAMAVSAQNVYAAGPFRSIGGQPREGLAGLNRATGTANGWDPRPNDLVNALAASGSTVYAGGRFSSVDGVVTGPFAVLKDGHLPPDVTAPTIAVTTPVEGQRFAQGQVVSSAFSCDDGGGSGVQSCSGPGSVDTATVGARQFVVTASDLAGNGATKTVNYVVRHRAVPSRLRHPRLPIGLHHRRPRLTRPLPLRGSPVPYGRSSPGRSRSA